MEEKRKLMIRQPAAPAQYQLIRMTAHLLWPLFPGCTVIAIIEGGPYKTEGIKCGLEAGIDVNIQTKHLCLSNSL